MILQAVRAAIDDIAKLHENGLAAGPLALAVDQARRRAQWPARHHGRREGRLSRQCARVRRRAPASRQAAARRQERIMARSTALASAPPGKQARKGHLPAAFCQATRRPRWALICGCDMIRDIRQRSVVPCVLPVLVVLPLMVIATSSCCRAGPGGRRSASFQLQVHAAARSSSSMAGPMCSGSSTTAAAAMTSPPRPSSPGRMLLRATGRWSTAARSKCRAARFGNPPHRPAAGQLQAEMHPQLSQDVRNERDASSSDRSG